MRGGGLSKKGARVAGTLYTWEKKIARLIGEKNSACAFHAVAMAMVSFSCQTEQGVIGSLFFLPILYMASWVRWLHSVRVSVA